MHEDMLHVRSFSDRRRPPFNGIQDIAPFYNTKLGYFRYTKELFRDSSNGAVFKTDWLLRKRRQHIPLSGLVGNDLD